MSRPSDLDLTAMQQHPWREVPMPGANLGLELVPLASAGETFTILGRFPAGFDRPTRGGYLGAEEFLVLDGFLEIEGQRYARGDLTFIPAGFLRTTMQAPEGCTVLAWFGGPAIFRTPDELGEDAVTDGIVSVRVDALLGEDFLVTSEARWSVGQAATGPDDDGVDLAMGTWWHGAAERDDLALRRTPVGRD
jgi:hypothetical protein